ncbi:MAG: hypothetical protein L6R28_13260 [Planctomycetes bacterium]|nr:hypothetical protein [Planctomycetota bacterium]
MSTEVWERMVFKTALKTRFGLTDRLIRMLGEPDERVLNPHYRSGPKASLYAVARVKKFIREHAPEIAALEQRRAKQAQAQAQRVKEATEADEREMVRKYPSWKDALPDAAAAMFNLNRFAKHRSCGAAQSSYIYCLKSRFVHLLYRIGCCEAAHLHLAQREGKVCYGCDGSGKPFYDDEYDNSGCPCYRCNGSGWYKPPSTIELVYFRFLVGGKTYSWHQPKDSVSFECHLAEATSDWVPDRGEKALTISETQIPEAEKLVRFVLARADADARNPATA